MKVSVIIIIIIIIINEEECHAKGSRQETKIQGFMNTDIRNVEHEMYDYFSFPWRRRP